MAEGALQIDLNVDLGLVHLELDVHLRRAVDRFHPLTNLLGGVPQLGKVVAVDADHHRVTGA